MPQRGRHCSWLGELENGRVSEMNLSGVDGGIGRGISGRGDTEAEMRSMLSMVERIFPTQGHKACSGAR